MAKLSKANLEILNEVMKVRMAHYARIITRIKNNDPTLPDYFDKPVAWYEGLLEASFMQCEDILMKNNKYRGFREYQLYGQNLRWYFVEGLAMPEYHKAATAV